ISSRILIRPSGSPTLVPLPFATLRAAPVEEGWSSSGRGGRYAARAGSVFDLMNATTNRWRERCFLLLRIVETHDDGRALAHHFVARSGSSHVLHGEPVSAQL